MRESPLNKLHEEGGAKPAEFAGWRLPLTFRAVAEEARACRETAALFDISHMGVVRIHGRSAISAASSLLSRKAEAISAKRGIYALLLNEEGGVLDDLWLMREEEGVRLVVNAVNHEKDVMWMGTRGAAGGREIDDLRGRTFGLALQGPRAEDIVKAAGWGGDLPTMFGEFVFGELAGARALLSRTGYTGEDGFEIFGEARDGVAAWRALIEAGGSFGITPAGLAARDVLRQEMGYPLWGHELDEDTTPIEAGLGWALDRGHEHIGREALTNRPVRKKRIGIKVRGKGIARAGEMIIMEGRQIGAVSSGIYSHNLGEAIAQGYVEAECELAIGANVEVESRGRRLCCEVASMPFIKRRTRLSWREIAKEKKA